MFLAFLLVYQRSRVPGNRWDAGWEVGGVGPWTLNSSSVSSALGNYATNSNGLLSRAMDHWWLGMKLESI